MKPDSLCVQNNFQENCRIVPNMWGMILMILVSFYPRFYSSVAKAFPIPGEQIMLLEKCAKSQPKHNSKVCHVCLIELHCVVGNLHFS